MKVTNITLIGMPTAGKTYLGKMLAEKYQKTWIDLDTASLSRTLANGGTEQDYLELEEEVLLSASGDGSVFSCGGSSVYSEKGMKHLADISKIVYLELPLEIVEERLAPVYHNRGVIGSRELTLTELYSQRTRLYQKYADHKISCGNNSTDEQFDFLCQLVESLEWSTS